MVRAPLFHNGNESNCGSAADTREAIGGGRMNKPTLKIANGVIGPIAAKQREIKKVPLNEIQAQPLQRIKSTHAVGSRHTKVGRRPYGPLNQPKTNRILIEAVE